MAKAPIKMVLHNRSYTLRTTLGHSIHFPKGEPVNVPTMLLSQAMAIGAQPVEGETAELEAPEVPEPEPADPEERLSRVKMAAEEIYEANDPDTFTASNNPKLAVLSDKVGFKVSKRELQIVLNARSEELENGDEG